MMPKTNRAGQVDEAWQAVDEVTREHRGDPGMWADAIQQPVKETKMENTKPAAKATKPAKPEAPAKAKSTKSQKPAMEECTRKPYFPVLDLAYDILNFKAREVFSTMAAPEQGEFPMVFVDKQFDTIGLVFSDYSADTVFAPRRLSVATNLYELWLNSAGIEELLAYESSKRGTFKTKEQDYFSLLEGCYAYVPPSPSESKGWGPFLIYTSLLDLLAQRVLSYAEFRNGGYGRVSLWDMEVPNFTFYTPEGNAVVTLRVRDPLVYVHLVNTLIESWNLNVEWLVCTGTVNGTAAYAPPSDMTLVDWAVSGHSDHTPGNLSIYISA